MPDKPIFHQAVFYPLDTVIGMWYNNHVQGMVLSVFAHALNQAYVVNKWEITI